MQPLRTPESPIDTLQAETQRGPRVWFASGFRPFFLAAGVYAVLALLAWMLAYLGVVQIPSPLGPIAFHVHEMTFGFAVAGVAGFLLTAVPKWTGTPPARSVPVALAFLAWLLGRVACWFWMSWPASLVVRAFSLAGL